MSALQIHVAHFRRRVIEDALLEATAVYWERRAADFDSVPRPDVALACRRHAWLLRTTGLDQEATAVLDEVLGRPAAAGAA